MDRLARLIVAGVIGLVIGMGSVGLAYAQTIPATLETQAPTTTTTYVGVTPCGTVGPGSAAAICPEVARRMAGHEVGLCGNQNGTANVTSITPAGANPPVCNYDRFWNGSPMGSGSFQLSESGSASTCPDGFTLTGGQCQRYVCPAGYQFASATTCVSEATCPPAGTGGTHNGTESSVQFPNVTRAQWEGLPRETNGDGCNGVCGYRFRRTAWIGGTMFVDAVSTGQTCTGVSAPSWPQAAQNPSTPTPTPNDAADCIRAGGSPGTVNGQFACVDRRATPDSTSVGTPTTSTTTRTNPDGSTTTTSTTQTPTTSCANGVCTTTTETTTTTTTVPAGGGAGTTTTETRTTTGSGTGAGGPGGTCDPATQQCGTESTFGGSCAAGFVCNGDAVQCAMAREQFIRNCETLGPSGVTSKAAAEGYVSDVASGKGLPADFMPRETKAMGAINTGERFSAGACPAPVTTNTPLGSFTIDFSPYCPLLSYFGLVILAAGLLIAARVAVGGL